MKQVHFSGVMVAVVAFAVAVTLAQKEVLAATAGKDKSASDAVRASDAGKSGGADAKEAPPAWVVSSTGTVARAEAGDAGAMEEIANGYRIFARESNDDEREAMIQEATKWMHRRAKVAVKDSEILARAENGDEAAMMELARGYLFLATARKMEAKGEERKSMFKKSIEWLRRRAEKISASGEADVIEKIAQEFLVLSFSPEFNLDQEEFKAMCVEFEKWRCRSDKIKADREGNINSVRKRAEAGDPAAQRNLGFRYSRGVDVEKDEKKAFEWTKKAAEQGDAKAMFNLANAYANGDGVEKDKEKAVKWYRRAANAFHVLAEKGEKLDLRSLCNVGSVLLVDESLQAQDVGMQFLEIAARCGDAEAMRLYGEQLAIGKAVDEDINEALLWLRRAYKRGDKQALEIIGQIHSFAWRRLFQRICDKADAGDTDAADKRDKIMRLYKRGLQGQDICMVEAQALAGYAPMQAELGCAYMTGEGVPQNKKKGVEWLRKAADQGEFRAMFWLGIAYEHGDGVTKDDWRAQAMWQKSRALGCDGATEKMSSLLNEYRGKAEKGDASAQFFVGVAYESGSAGKPDAAKAVEWYRKAAEQGHPGAQAFLGWALQNGQGIEKNLTEAVSWYRKAAVQGNPEAQQNLGRCLFYGDGCKENEQEAVSWYRKAAEQGESSAMFNLGACYMDGTGVKKDVAEATKWFKRAASRGHKRSAKMLEMLQKDSAR